MYSREYFLSLIQNTFLSEIDIPLKLLQDAEAVQLIIRYNWLINTNISDYGWATLCKGRHYRN